MFFSFDYYIYMLPALVLMMIAQWYVQSSYRRWSRVRNQRNITGEEAVSRLIRASRLPEIEVETVRGNLTDHYDPRKKTLRLSAGVAQSPSVASLAGGSPTRR